MAHQLAVVGYLEVLSKWLGVVQSLVRSPGALRLSEESELSYVETLISKASEGYENDDCQW